MVLKVQINLKKKLSDTYYKSLPAFLHEVPTDLKFCPMTEIIFEQTGKM